MLILGIECATWLGSVALEEEGRIVAESSGRARLSHAETLPDLVRTVLESAGARLQADDAIAFSRGPGSFTGLRIGLSLAKGLALALGAKLIGVPTLDALAVASLPWEGRLCACLDARKQEVYAALYERRNGTITKVTKDLVLAPADLARAIEGECTFVGDAVCVYGEEFSRLLGPRAKLRRFDLFPPRASALCRLARLKLATCGGQDLEAAEPVYVRPPQAEMERAQPAGGLVEGVDNEEVVYYEHC